MSRFDSLPNEVVYHILSFLDFKSLGTVAQTCKHLESMARLDIFWQKLSKRDYQFESIEGWGDNTTFLDIYSKVLHPYGKCRGLWRDSSAYYGFFIHVKFEKGQFVAYFCHFPARNDVCQQLEWFSPIFTVTLVDGECHVTCSKGASNTRLQVKDGFLQFKCEHCKQSVDALSEDDMLLSWIGTVGLEPYMTYELALKHTTVIQTTKLWSDYQLRRITPPVQSPLSPITLGLYKGTYGAHGIEIIHLTMADNGYQILGDKILGDPNVPAGKISLFIDLRKPLILTEEQQDFEFLDSLEAETQASPYSFPAGATQPFAVSGHVLMREERQSLPKTCRARYAAEGRIAASGYINPSLSRAHFVVFSEDYFGFLWLDLSSFSVFKLTENNFHW